MACSSPITIPNKNLVTYIDGSTKASNFVGADSAYIQVPCGHCPDCLRTKQLYIVQRSQAEMIAGNDLYFFTLTYRNKMLPHTKIGDKTYWHVDQRDVYLMFKRIRKNNLFPAKFKYFLVSEYGGKRNRMHFHGLISMPPLRPNETRAEKIGRGIEIHNIMLNEWRRNIGSTRNPKWLPLCTYIVTSQGRRTFDCHYVAPDLSPNAENDVAFYVTKYCLKPNEKMEKLRKYLHINFSSEDYRKYWRKIGPQIWFSRNFGSANHPAVIAHVNKGIDLAIQDKSPYPYFINPIDGKTFPLCTFFRQRIFNKDTLRRLSLFYTVDPNKQKEGKSLYQVFRDYDKFKNIRQQIEDRDIIDFFPEDD